MAYTELDGTFSFEFTHVNGRSRATRSTTVANSAKGEKPGERGAGPVKPTGYPGRRSQQR